MTDEKDTQKKFFEMQMLEQQSKQIQAQLQALASQLTELKSTKESIQNVSDSKGKEILVPLGAGVFMKSESKGSDDFIVNVGAEVAVEKKGDEIITLIDEQISEMLNIQKELQGNLDMMNSKSQELQKELQGMMG